jgi:hypothetical protein
MDYSNPPLEKRGIGAFEAEIRASGDLLFVAFAPESGWLNAVGGTHLLMAAPLCPEGPMLAGRFVVRGVGAGEGSLCLSRSVANGVLGASDCGRTPQLWDARVKGFATEGIAPCCVLCKGGGERNLELVSFTAPSVAAPGEAIGSVIEVIVRNAGPADIEGPISVGLFLSPDPRIEIRDAGLAGGRVAIDALAAGDRRRVPFPEAAVPGDQSLDVSYLGVLVDDRDGIPEAVEADNVAALPIVIRPEPDPLPGAAARVASATALPGETVSVPIEVRGAADSSRFELTLACPGLEIIDVGTSVDAGREGRGRTMHLSKGEFASLTGSSARVTPSTWITLGHVVLRAPAGTTEATELSFEEAKLGSRTLETSPGTFEALEPVPSAFGLRASARHPSTGRFAIELRVPEGMSREIDVGIYDFHGKLVNPLLEGSRGPGRHGLVWDGGNRRGEPLEPGIYFVRMTGPSFQKTRKLVLE